MGFPRAPLQLPDVRLLIGGPVDSVEELVNYGYRAAWRLRSGSRSVAIKADIRPGFQENELRAHRNASRAGVPVPEAIGFAAAPVPTLALEWVDAVSLPDAGTPESWRQAGALLARAHSAPPLRQPDRPWSDLILTWFASELPYVVEHAGLEQTEADEALRRAEALRLALDTAPPVWLHGDCQADHFLVDHESADVVALIDWADAQPGDPVMDFAVLGMSGGLRPEVLKGYGADAELRGRTRLLLPLYHAVRAAGAVRWLDEHGYPESTWPLTVLQRFIQH